jgi:hypothetical protein
MSRLRTSFLVLLLAACCCPVAVFAQPGFESTNVGDTPVNSGVVWLLLVGIALGVRMLFKRVPACSC